MDCPGYERTIVMSSSVHYSYKIAGRSVVRLVPPALATRNFNQSSQLYAQCGTQTKVLCHGLQFCSVPCALKGQLGKGNDLSLVLAVL